MEPTSTAAEFWGHKHALEQMVGEYDVCAGFEFGYDDHGPGECQFWVGWQDKYLEGGAVRLSNPNPYRLIDDAFKLFTDTHPGSWGVFSSLSSHYLTAEKTALHERGPRSWESQISYGVGA